MNIRSTPRRGTHSPVMASPPPYARPAAREACQGRHSPAQAHDASASRSASHVAPGGLMPVTASALPKPGGHPSRHVLRDARQDMRHPRPATRGDAPSPTLTRASCTLLHPRRSRAPGPGHAAPLAAISQANLNNCIATAQQSRGNLVGWRCLTPAPPGEGVRPYAPPRRRLDWLSAAGGAPSRQSRFSSRCSMRHSPPLFASLSLYRIAITYSAGFPSPPPSWPRSG